MIQINWIDRIHLSEIKGESTADSEQRRSHYRSEDTKSNCMVTDSVVPYCIMWKPESYVVYSIYIIFIHLWLKNWEKGKNNAQRKLRKSVRAANK